MSAVTIHIRQRAGGHELVVKRGGSIIASDWIASWRKARSAAETIAEHFGEQGIDAEIIEHKEAGTAA